MEYTKATIDDMEEFYDLVQNTIQEVYPKYYPEEVVRFFSQMCIRDRLGDVMKESARAGISYIRSVSKEHGIDEKFFKEHDIHIHIPEGAVPKDGPSAGDVYKRQV